MIRRAILSAGLALLSTAALAADPPPPAAAPDDGTAFLASLKPQAGQVTLPGGLATLNLSERFRYLSPEDSKRVIEGAWRNPPGAAQGVLGMIVPAGLSPANRDGWGVVITYSDDGHVSDSDANAIDYTAILKQMQEATRDHNAARTKAGYPAVTLAGWAEPPHYDASSHKIYWAKDLAFDNVGEHTLNYSIRVLGRKGVLELNAVAGMSQLAAIRQDMKDVVGCADFTQGNRYADFNSSTDKLAAYGLAALVAGGVAAKTGLLAKLIAMALALKKVIILAFAGAAAWLRRLFKRKASAGVNPA